MPFDLTARLGLDGSGLVSGLTQARAQVNKFQGQIQAGLGNTLGGLKGQFAAAFGAGALIAAGKAVVDYGSQIADTALKTGIAVTKLQALDYAASQTSASLDQISDALKDLAVSQQEALGGDKGKIGYFQDLGVTFEELKQNSPEQVFYAISKAVQDAESPTEKLNALLKVMGESADKLVPAMRAGLGEVAQNFDEGGLALNEGMIDKLKSMGMDWTTRKAQLRKLGGAVLTGGTDLGGAVVSALSAPIAGLFSGKDAFNQQLERAADNLVSASRIMNGPQWREMSQREATNRTILQNAEARRAQEERSKKALENYQERMPGSRPNSTAADVKAIRQWLEKGGFGAEPVL